MCCFQVLVPVWYQFLIWLVKCLLRVDRVPPPPCYLNLSHGELMSIIYLWMPVSIGRFQFNLLLLQCSIIKATLFFCFVFLNLANLLLCCSCFASRLCDYYLRFFVFTAPKLCNQTVSSFRTIIYVKSCMFFFLIYHVMYLFLFLFFISQSHKFKVYFVSSSDFQLLPQC